MRINLFIVSSTGHYLMGIFDSTKTRVTPVFDHLVSADPSGRTWLGTLLQLPRHGSGSQVPIDPGVISKIEYGAKEELLEPPKTLLHWLIEHPDEMSPPANMGSSRTAEKRRALLLGDPHHIQEAHAGVNSGKLNRMWYVFESASHPDVYIETDRAIVVIEGKRTESGPTLSTSWMPVRHQMIRHLDGGLDLAGERCLSGFFIVEGDPQGAVPAEWVQASGDTISDQSLARGLPHRSAEQIARIRTAFLGVATWQGLCAELGIPSSALLERVGDC
jgi:hypothetical protein